MITINNSQLTILVLNRISALELCSLATEGTQEYGKPYFFLLSMIM